MVSYKNAEHKLRKTKLGRSRTGDRTQQGRDKHQSGNSREAMYGLNAEAGEWNQVMKVFDNILIIETSISEYDDEKSRISNYALPFCLPSGSVQLMKKKEFTR